MSLCPALSEQRVLGFRFQKKWGKKSGTFPTNLDKRERLHRQQGPRGKRQTPAKSVIYFVDSAEKPEVSAPRRSGDFPPNHLIRSYERQFRSSRCAWLERAVAIRALRWRLRSLTDAAKAGATGGRTELAEVLSALADGSRWNPLKIGLASEAALH